MIDFFKKEENNEELVTDIWQKFKSAEKLQNETGQFNNIQKYYNFYENRQWENAETGGEILPSQNIVTPICNHKISQICMNNISMIFLPVSNSEENGVRELCNNLNRLASMYWEKLKMERVMWSVVKDACIAGCEYLFFYDDKLNFEIISSTDIFFADEQQKDLQKQDWIIIKGRETVESVKSTAQKNGISEELCEQIVSDSNVFKELGEDAKKELQGTEKCTTLLYLSRDKETGVVKFARSTQFVVYQSLKELSAEKVILSKYPVAAMIWSEKKGSCRGSGEVAALINNQIALNKTLATRYVATKLNAYGKPVYSSQIINPEDIDKVGVALMVEGDVRNVSDAFTYINPCPTSAEAKYMTDELRNVTRELSGASDAALGNVNPEKASGASILAAVEQSAIPLNEQKSAFKQLIEDIASIWKDMLFLYKADEVFKNVTLKDTQNIDISIRIDVSSATLASRLAEDEILDGYLKAGYITFEERVDALSDASVAPKGILSSILKKRQQQEELKQEELMNMEGVKDENLVGGDGNGETLQMPSYTDDYVG